MPEDAGQINTGDALNAVFTYDAIQGTPPYTYTIEVAGIGSSGITYVETPNGGAVDVTFDATLARAGSYVLELRGRVDDANGDVDQDDPDDFDTYTIEVLPITATWATGSLTIPALELGTTSAEQDTLTQQTGGAAPYVYDFEWVGGIPAGLSIVTSGGSSNTVQIAASADIAGGTYVGTIRGQISDATGQTEGPFDIPVSVTVVGFEAAYDKLQISGSVAEGNAASTDTAILSPTGGVGPFTYIHNFLVIPTPEITISAAGANLTVIASDTLEQGTYSGVVLGQIRDSAGNQANTSIGWSITITAPALSPFEDLIATLNPLVDWQFIEPSLPIVNYGANAIDGGDLASALRTPQYQVVGANLADAGGPGKLAANVAGGGAASAEGWYVDDTELDVFNIPSGAAIFIARYTGDHATGSTTDRNTLLNAEATPLNRSRVVFELQEPSNGEFAFRMYDATGNERITMNSLRDYTGDQCYHLFIINQPGDASGPQMFVDKWEETSGGITVDPGFDDYWFADLYAAFLNATVGYRPDAGSDGSTSNSDQGADLDIDRIILTENPVTLTTVQQLHELYFGVQDGWFMDAEPAAGNTGNMRPMRFYATSFDGSQFQQGVPRGNNVYTGTSGWNDCRFSEDGRFHAIAISSNGDKVESTEYNPANDQFERLTNTGWSSFRTAVDFSNDSSGEILLLGCGESATRAELARWTGTQFSLITTPFDTQPPTNVFAARFYNNGNNIAMGSSLSGGTSLRVWERQAYDNWDIMTLGVDTQPAVGTSRGGMANSSTHLAVMGTIATPSDETEVNIYSFDSGGNLTLVSTNNAGMSGQRCASQVGMDFTPDGRFLYTISYPPLGDDLARLRCWDRDNSWNQVVLTNWTDANILNITDLVISPDGRYLVLIWGPSNGRRNEVWTINGTTGQVEFLKYMTVNSTTTDTSGSGCGAFSKGYYSG